MRTALRHIDDVDALERLPLARLRCVASSQQPPGRALQHLLRRACESLRPNDGPPQRHAPVWRRYIALHEQYMHGRHPDWVASQLALSAASYYRVAGEALDAVLAFVCASEDQTAALPTVPAARRIELLPLPGRHALIGRERESRALQQLLLPGAGHCPDCVGIYGLPGVGKTELLKSVVHDGRLRARFDVVLWAGLGRRPNVAAILRSWALLLEVPEAHIAGMPGVPELSRLVHAAARDRRIMIVLDDVWNALDAHPLQIAGQGGCVLLSTRLPEVAIALAGQRALRIHELSSTNAVDLLRSFVPDVFAQHEQRVAALADKLGGMPVALVLAGKYLQETTMLGVRNRAEQALDKLQQSIFSLPMRDVLEGERADDHTLSTVIAQLLDVLSPEARAALPAIATLLPKPDTFSEEAMLAVTGITIDSCDELVRCGVLESAGDDRYAMHQLIADYLRRNETSASDWESLIDAYTGIVLRAEGDLDRLAHDENNLLDVLRRASEFGHDEALATLLLPTMPLLDARAQWASAEPLLERLAHSDHARAHPMVLADVWLNLASCALMLRRHAFAAAHAREAIAVAEVLGCERKLCRALDVCAQAAFELNDAPSALLLAERALSIALRLDDPLLRMCARVTHARMTAARGDLAHARAALHQAEVEGAGLRDAAHRRSFAAAFAKAWLEIGHFGYFDGQLVAAERAAQTALGFAARSDALLEADCMQTLAWLAFSQGRVEEARQRADALVARTHCAAGAKLDVSGAHLLLGILAQHGGDLAGMRAQFERACAALPERRSTSLFSAAVICALVARAYVQTADDAPAAAAIRLADSLASAPAERGIVALVDALHQATTNAPRTAAARLDDARTCLAQTTLSQTALVARELALVESTICAVSGDRDAAVVAARNLLTQSRRHSAPAAIALASLQLAEALMRAGQHAEASRHACNAADMYASCGHTRAQAAQDLATYLGQRRDVNQDASQP